MVTFMVMITTFFILQRLYHSRGQEHQCIKKSSGALGSSNLDLDNTTIGVAVYFALAILNKVRAA